MARANETETRIVIDERLRDAGWDPSDRSQVRTERAVQVEVDGQIHRGYADYVLYDQDGRPLAVIEAKATAIQPYVAKQQALPYARQLGAPFIFLTNGDLIYFWDYMDDDARIVDAFFSRRDLARIRAMRQSRVPMAAIAIPETYLRQGELREVRPYQREAMQSLDTALEIGKRRFLIELPTGTGKTDLICLYMKRLIQADRAERVLFLVDRDQLAKQAIEAFQDVLPDYGSYWLKTGTAREEKQITVCLLQTMIGRYREFTSGYFDVVIMDESHRSIYGAWQTALTHFDAVHIGLTATPAEYIERNTYRFYGCNDRKPDFSYTIQEAFQEKYLAPYRFADGITEVISQGADIDEEHYDPVQFEREWTNEQTNRLMMEEFDRLAHENFHDLAPGQVTAPGKAIVFAITKNHAARLAQYLNELHPEAKGRYAELITSDVAGVDALIQRFKREQYPQVAVSVGMLDTGFDCREVLHIVLCRRVRSAILYQQIRGRGTRTAPHIGKRAFVIYDFFGNRAHFNDSDTDVFTGTDGGNSASVGVASPVISQQRDITELGIDDAWLRNVTYVEIGPDGERMERVAYLSRWNQAIIAREDEDSRIRKIRDGEPLTDDELVSLADDLNRPAMYFNEENLRRASVRPNGTLVDFVREALGKLQIKSREERLTENFHAWLVSKNLTPQQAQYLSLIKNRGIVGGKLRLDDLLRPPLSILNAAALGVELFGQRGLREIIGDLDESVFAPDRAQA